VVLINLMVGGEKRRERGRRRRRMAVVLGVVGEGGYK
jgi:hypothetical protein